MSSVDPICGETDKDHDAAFERMLAASRSGPLALEISGFHVLNVSAGHYGTTPNEGGVTRCICLVTGPGAGEEHHFFAMGAERLRRLRDCINAVLGDAK